jgi:archaellum component FlaC
MTQNGITKMPGFEKILSQEAAWAIRTYVETRPADGAFDEQNGRLAAIRDELKAKAEAIAGGAKAEDFAEDIEGLQKELNEINASAETASKAPKAESAVSRAANALDGSAESFAKAAELLTIGLSAAK